MTDWPKSSLQELMRKARYGGNPEHKMRPNDYGLTPMRKPNPRKTLCDRHKQFPKYLAERLLKQGFERGMVSANCENGWPQNVWAVLHGIAYEAQLENRESGTYHGYPMTADDDFDEIIREEWGTRGQ